MAEYAALIGIDWSDKKHDVCLIDPASGKREASVLAHSPQAIDEWATALRQRFGGRPVAVCLEQSRGPLVYALLKYDFLTIFPVNPKTLSKYREAFSPSRHKDDPPDAAYLAELLLHHRDRLRAWTPDNEQTRCLRYLVEHRRRLVDDRTRISNRMTSLLKCYFPQVLEWFPDIRTELVCDFLLRWPSLDALTRVRRETLEKFFRAHHSVRADTLRQRVEAIKRSVPLVTDRAIIASSVLLTKALAAQMKAALSAIREFDREIEALCSVHEDYDLFQSLPGAGHVYASRLTAALGSDRSRWQSADELSCLAGVAPVIERSGQSCWVRWRYFCPKFLRQTFVEYAGESTKHSFWARAYYEQQRAKGKSHHAAVRALAFKWVRIIFRCWQTRTAYDEVQYLESLRKKGSRLLNFVANNPA
ncbi:MAG: IS110 family transposase [Acidobacteria bacterium]|nr:IS110 family transposase [Acidobacteriota bacterium]